jgi:hypothetical protein
MIEHWLGIAIREPIYKEPRLVDLRALKMGKLRNVLAYITSIWIELVTLKNGIEDPIVG